MSSADKADIARRAFITMQKLLPQHGLSRLVGHLAKSHLPWVRKPFIEGFARAYKVNMSEAARTSLSEYSCFNDFFTRELKPGGRPLASDEQLAISPADGVISQAGRIEQGRLMQAKGNAYALAALAGEPCDRFNGGTFATVYLAPRDYHRVHVPLAGRLVKVRTIPGALFSVNATTEAEIPSLFARNERLVCHFETDHGEMLVVLVGALIVASIETVWGSPISPYRSISETAWQPQQRLSFQRGDEIGRFLLGSTVVVCLENQSASLAEGVTSGQSIRMGERLFQFQD